MDLRDFHVGVLGLPAVEGAFTDPMAAAKILVGAPALDSFRMATICSSVNLSPSWSVLLGIISVSVEDSLSSWIKIRGAGQGIRDEFGRAPVWKHIQPQPRRRIDLRRVAWHRTPGPLFKNCIDLLRGFIFYRGTMPWGGGGVTVK